MKTKLLVLGLAIGAIALVQPLSAANSTSNVSVSATVSATAKLSVGTSTLTFPNADPDVTPSIVASEGAVSISAKAKTSAGSTVTLTLLAAGDLLSGTDSIAISNLTWSASGTDFVSGTMSKTAAQTVASWSNSGTRSGSQSFALANSWSYATGSYSAQATYTLTAP